jgi:hypothetical protein
VIEALASLDFKCGSCEITWSKGTMGDDKMLGKDGKDKLLF